ncbi:response regulator transcription factor [Paraburkholderia fungorum]|uniref:response regulator n=1 Tax=Paraburkholderia fungorum TaxID=134537 RepID=UPI0038BCE918
MVHVLIADDHPVVRAGLRHLIATTAGIVVSAEAAQGTAVLDLLRMREFDLLLLDMSMPDITGVDLIHQIRIESRTLPILLLGEGKEAAVAARALRAGATGYVTKDADPEILLSAIRKLASGGRFVDPRLVDALVFDPKPSDAPARELLSGREFQVLQMLADGKRINEIAETFALSAKTVSTHNMRLMQKLCITNHSELIRYSIRHGVLAA